MVENDIQIHFHVVKHPPDEGKKAKAACYLVRNEWDDYGYKTSFDCYLFDLGGKRNDLGRIKILRTSQTGDYTEFDNTDFTKLGEDYCSLGMSTEYYEMLASMGQFGWAMLTAIRDVAIDPKIHTLFKNHEGFKNSFLRGSGGILGLRKGASYFNDTLPSEPFSFFYTPVNNGEGKLEFDVSSGSFPPTNMHVIIGRNGTGKTRLLSHLAFCAEAGERDRKQESFISTYGEAEFEGGLKADQYVSRATEGFQNVIAISFSAFDTFQVPTPGDTEDTAFNYAYIGLRNIEEIEEGGALTITNTLKKIDDLKKDLVTSLVKNTQGIRKDRWHRTVKFLSSDPVFASLNVESLLIDDDEKNISARVDTLFTELSSGHKIVLVVVSKIVELMQEKSLVLFDEPEAYLHPPLLASLLRALSDLLVRRNALAIISTHSPVVLQEVPRSCVYILRRDNDIIIRERPRIETFAQNLGELTQEVFRLEVTKSGYYALIQEAAEALTYDEILEYFGQQLGAEGRAIAFALAQPKKKDEEA